MAALLLPRERQGLLFREQLEHAAAEAAKQMQLAHYATEQLQYYRERANFLERERIKTLRQMVADVLEEEAQVSSTKYP